MIYAHPSYKYIHLFHLASLPHKARHFLILPRYKMRAGGNLPEGVFVTVVHFEFKQAVVLQPFHYNSEIITCEIGEDISAGGLSLGCHPSLLQ